MHVLLSQQTARLMQIYYFIASYFVNSFVGYQTIQYLVFCSFVADLKNCFHNRREGSCRAYRRAQLEAAGLVIACRWSLSFHRGGY